MEIRQPTPQEELKFAAKALDEIAELAVEQYGFHLRPAVIKSMLEMVRGKEKIFPQSFTRK
ncbi:TPA: hypothetical protein ACMDOB_000527 [Vibrio metschnikovii]